MTKKFAIISAMAVTSLFLAACGSKESEKEVSAVENEVTITEESTVEESSIEESSTEESTIEESTTAESETETATVTDEPSFTVAKLDKDMYVSQECDSFQEPYDTSVIYAKLSKGDLLHLTGEITFQENQEDAVWYQFQADNGETGYVNGECLSTENPNAQQEKHVAQQEPPQPTQSEQQISQPEQQPTQTETTQPEQQPASSEVAQQPTTEQQPESNSSYDWNPDNVINPETGQPVQPGDSYDMGDGVEIHITGMTADEYLRQEGIIP